MNLRVKRVYDEPSGDDGLRVLVDRLWPRGLSKDAAALDLWIREIAPSDELRKWYSHDDKLWKEFRKRYFAELDANADVVKELRDYVGRHKATLLFSTKHTEYNNATALLEYLTR
ncbi:MAG TPA: DUF488 family protein [Gemmatimonadales bacterium]|nr:DUF488 family protein [Gemmatimonadales bacterium]